MELELITVNVEEENAKEDIVAALREVSNYDLDFNGENGPEYLWESAEGFESNQDYLIDYVSQYNDAEKMIKTFMDIWMDKDAHYYIRNSYEIIKNKTGKIVAICFAYVTDL